MKFKVSIENISHYHGKLNKIFCANICAGIDDYFFSLARSISDHHFMCLLINKQRIQFRGVLLS